MNRIFKSYSLICALLALLSLGACSKSKSYSELLRDEEKAVNWYLADHKVITEIPADTVFECGPDAPFYRLDDDGRIYMQVIDPGTKDNKAKKDQLIYFRYMRTNIVSMYRGENPQPMGNANNVANNSASFRFNNQMISTSQRYGAGIQLPLHYLPIDCEVNVVIKAYYGFSDEAGACQPFLFNLKYYPAQF